MNAIPGRPDSGDAAPSRSRVRRRRWIVGLAAVLVAAGLASAVAAWVDIEATPGPTTALQAPDDGSAGSAGAAGAPPPAGLDPSPAQTPALPVAELTELLERRAAAALAGDSTAFLRTVSSRSVTDLEQQRILAGNVDEVGFTRWTYTLGPQVPDEDDTAARLKERLGEDVLILRVDLAYRIRGYDIRTVESERVLAFVNDVDGWRVAADVDTGAFRSPWDVTPVTAFRGDSALVLNASTSVSGSQLARISDAAVGSVTRFWGRDWDRRVVVVVPASQKQMGALLRRDPDRYDNLAAVATSELSGDSFNGAANRVWVNPGTWGQVSAVGRAIVLRHEITHVATGAAVPGDFPIWLEEGLAEYIGYSGSGVATPIIAEDLFTAVRQDRGPADLPDRDAFTPTGGGLSVAYQGAWWAMKVIEERAGPGGVLAVYRAALEAPDAAGADDVALRRTLGLSRAEFVQEWRQSMRARAAQ